MAANIREYAFEVTALTALAAAFSLAFAFQGSAATGCLERDAASRSAIYKLIVRVEQGTRPYRLVPPADLDLAPYVGKSLEVNGNISSKTTGGREEWEIAVKSVKVIGDRCE